MYYRSKNSSSYTDVHVKDLGFLIKEQDAILIDVRTPKEIAAGVIGQPLEIELGLGMKEKFKSLDKNKKYILYCRSGRRSVTASKIMAGLGFSDVNNLVGGYIAWKNGE
ncbi:MAG: rhodanese-like domain-containing protein [Bacteroidota bacterium]